MNEQKQEAQSAKPADVRAFFQGILYDDVTQAYDAAGVALLHAEQQQDHLAAGYLRAARDALFAARLLLDPPTDA